MTGELSSKSQKITFLDSSDKQKPVYIDYTGLHEAAERLKNLYKRKSQARFDLAFGAQEEFKHCRKTSQEYSFYDFIKDILRKNKDLPWKFNSFKQGYAIVKSFPDLKIRSRRKLFYSHYRAIANADLNKREKCFVRDKFEKKMEKEGKVTIDQIKNFLKKQYGLGSYGVKDKTITFKTKRHFLRRVGAMVSAYKDIKHDSEVNVKLKLIKQASEQKKKAPSKNTAFSVRIKKLVESNLQ